MNANKYLRIKWSEEVFIEGPDNDKLNFVLKYMNGMEKDKCVSEVYELDDKTKKLKARFEDLNQYYFMHCVIEAPFSKGKKVWKDLNPNERFELLNTSPDWIRNPLIKKLMEMNEGGSVKKKLK